MEVEGLLRNFSASFLLVIRLRNETKEIEDVRACDQHAGMRTADLYCGGKMCITLRNDVFVFG